MVNNGAIPTKYSGPYRWESSLLRAGTRHHQARFAQRLHAKPKDGGGPKEILAREGRGGPDVPPQSSGAPQARGQLRPRSGGQGDLSQGRQ